MTLKIIDMHTAGEPVRIVVGGYPSLAGATILEKRQDAKANHDHLRRLMMLEPRGHADMYGVIPVTRSNSSYDAAVLFMHGAGYSTMCGHATIAVGKHLIESGEIAAGDGEVTFTLECPCGPVEVTSVVKAGKVRSSSFLSVPSFLHAGDVAVETTHHGTVTTDIAYGGAFYAVLPASRFGLSLMDSPIEALKAAASDLTESIRAHHTIDHPEESDLGFCYGTILAEQPHVVADCVNHHLCFFADGQLDRSPTGSGVTARLAVAQARGEVAIGESVVFKGISGVGFEGSIHSKLDYHGLDASVIRVGGRAHYTGEQTLTWDDDDPLLDGFITPQKAADIWRT